MSFSGLVLASSVSLGFLQIIAHFLKGNAPEFKESENGDDKMYNPYLKDAAFWFVGLSLSCLISTIIGSQYKYTSDCNGQWTQIILYQIKWIYN